MELKEQDLILLNLLEVGVSITTLEAEDPGSSEWIFVNNSRCRMSGFSREEIMRTQPYAQASRETRAQIKKINKVVQEKGQFIIESVLLHKSNVAIPVMIHMKLIEVRGEKAVLIEISDISSFKETESRLKLSQESSAEMLTFIEKDKQNLTNNFTHNLGMVLLPLVDQLHLSATDHQKDILNLMVKRIEDVGRDIGIETHMGSFGANLTRRQILICEMIRDGMTSKEIAMVLDCSPSTINNHRNLIRKKLKLEGKSTNLQAFLNKTRSG